jgi:hypothetical protein
MKRKSANWQKRRDLAVLFLLFVISVVKFQNCAPANTVSAQSSSADESSPVSVIDDTRSGISFASKVVQVQTSDQTVTIEGDCIITEDGPALVWQVGDASGANVVASGTTLCDQGHFAFDVAPSQVLDCGVAYLVDAGFGQGPTSEITVTRSCDSTQISN